MKIAIFIEPQQAIKNLILKWKVELKKKFGNQKYLNHPVHSTIAVLDLEEKISKKILFTLKKRINKTERFKILLTKPNIFYNDPFTKGNTLHYELKVNKKLLSLQKSILRSFQGIKKKENINLNLNKIFMLNYKKYGFPFIGKNWKPHLTIASIDKKQNDKKFIEKFKKTKISKFFFDINFISVWKIKGDVHKRIAKFKLK